MKMVGLAYQIMLRRAVWNLHMWPCTAVVLYLFCRAMQSRAVQEEAFWRTLLRIMKAYVRAANFVINLLTGNQGSESP